MLVQLSWAYIYSATVEALEENRQNLIDYMTKCGHPEHKRYIIDNWQKRESRLILCYTSSYTNLGAVATQRAEGFNKIIHKNLSHQMSLQQAAQALTRYVSDRSRDIGVELVRSSTENVPNLNRKVFQALSGSITIPAIHKLKAQWKLLTNGTIKDECSGTFYKQHLLPCAHKLTRYFLTGETIPRSMVHPRYWIDEVLPPSSDWQPTHARHEVAQQPAPTEDLAVQQEIDELLEIMNSLEGEAQRRYRNQVHSALQNARQIGIRRQEEEAIPLGLPLDRPRMSYRPILTANQAYISNARSEARQLAAQLRDERILQQRAQDSLQQQAQDSSVLPALTPPPTESTKQVPTTPPPAPSPLPSKPSRLVATFVAELPLSPPRPPPIPTFEPPASTAPPVLQHQDQEQGRGKRQRAHTKRWEEAQAQAKRR